MLEKIQEMEKKNNLKTKKSKNKTGFMGPYAYCQDLKRYNCPR